MRRPKLPAISVVLALSAFAFLLAQMPQQQQMKPEEVRRALSLVAKPEPVPEKYKVGFESITPKDTLAMLTYLASDWMEGRDTGSRGYAIAADYVVSLFKLWGIKPGGDRQPASAGFMRAMGSQPAPPAPPAERSYFQEFALKEITESKTTLKVEVARAATSKARTFESGVDFSGQLPTAEDVSGPVVFVGYGIKEPSIGWDELKGMMLKDKIVLVLTEAPGRDDPKSPFNVNKELKEKYFPQVPTAADIARQRGGPGRFNKLEEIYKQEPAAVLVVQNTRPDAEIFNSLTASQARQPSDERPIIRRVRTRMLIPGARETVPGAPGQRVAPTINITREMANFILENTGKTIDELKQTIEKTYKPASRDLPGTKVSISTTVKANLVRTMNIIGYLEGSDPQLKDEVFVIGAHFDHLGKWEDYVFNGSDDNASGSVGVISIARALALNPVKPKRTVVFCLWTGEERGLLGSRYYVQNPTFPIEKTVGYLNYDMISRPFDQQTITRTTRMLNVQGVEDLVKQIRPAYFVTVNATKDSGFYEIQQEMNKYVGLDLFIREPELGAGSGGSDHSSFAAVKKPFVYYMTAMHSDYHQTGDSADKASGELLAKVIQLGYLTTFAFADK